MKVLVNGGLNLSTLDGWWAEAFDGDCGWALGSQVDQSSDDTRDAAQLYSLLEEEVIPAYYTRDAQGFPRQWIARMRASMAHLAPRFSGARMLQEYVNQVYVPAASAFRRRRAHAGDVAKDLQRWSQHLEQHWAGIRFGEMTSHANKEQLTVSVPVYLGDITADSVRVEIYADPENGESPFVLQMAAVEPIADVPNASVYRATLDTVRSPGDFTARVVPYHREARIPIEMPLIVWQR
jgi:starch phosphorylase